MDEFTKEWVLKAIAHFNLFSLEEGVAAVFAKNIEGGFNTIAQLRERLVEFAISQSIA